MVFLTVKYFMKYFGNVYDLIKYFKTQCLYSRLVFSAPWGYCTYLMMLNTYNAKYI